MVTSSTTVRPNVNHTSAAVMLVSDPKRYSWSRGRALSGEAGDQHATGQAAVEEQGQRDVAVGVAAFADDLDQDGAEDRDDDGGPASARCR